MALHRDVDDISNSMQTSTVLSFYLQVVIVTLITNSHLVEKDIDNGQTLGTHEYHVTQTGRRAVLTCKFRCRRKEVIEQATTMQDIPKSKCPILM